MSNSSKTSSKAGMMKFVTNLVFWTNSPTSVYALEADLLKPRGDYSQMSIPVTIEINIEKE